jgi:hypothetical protein
VNCPGKAGQREGDEAGVVVAQGLGIQPQPGHDAGAEILDHHVGARGERPCRGHTAGRLQVESDAFLASRQHVEGGIAPARATSIKPGWRVDADHLGTQIGQHHADQRPGEVLAEIENPDTVEGAFHNLAFRGLP